jgi:hypothetical protein
MRGCLMTAGHSMMPGDAETALEDGTLVAAESVDGGRRDFGEATIVAAKPEEGVVGETEFTEAAAERADAAVEGDEFAVVVLRGFREGGEGGAVAIRGFERGVGRAIPNDGESGFGAGTVPREEFQGLGDNDFGRISFEFFELSATAEERIAVKKIGGGEPLVETELTGVVIIGGEDGSAGAAETVEVPFAEMRSGVAGVAEGARQRFFLAAERVAVVFNAGAVVVAPGHDGGAGRRAIRGASVEAVEAETGGGHGVEVGRFKKRMAVIAGFAPAHVVGHDEDDVGAGRRGRCMKEAGGFE